MDKQGKIKMKTFEIKLWGTVQGVGFRPFVHRLAKEHGLTGFVANDGSCVLIVIKADNKKLEEFIRDLKQKKPQSSDIVNLQVTENTCGVIASKEKLQNVNSLFDDFIIKPSTDNSESPVFIAPDIAVCDNCLNELYRETDRRYLHPFISCMECGPRFTIIDMVPYDRENTTMSDFPMCASCLKEYKDIDNIRCHAQTVSCHDCGPQLEFVEAGKVGKLTGFEAFLRAVEILKQGGILAVKGIGGFHLCCSPFNEDSVNRLRKLKGREEKPFAVMFDNIAEIEKYCIVSSEEKKQLLSRERPIVLLKRKKSDICKSVFKSSKYLGCFMVYTPLHKMLINSVGPLVMTSANISDRPIIIDNEKIMSLMDKGLSGVLYNDRRILSGIDDSVIKVNSSTGIQFIRRARGFVPLPLYLGDRFKNVRPILACGSDLKNTFCIAQNGYAYLSQYGGDLEEEEAFRKFRENIKRFERIFKIKPEKICCDLHPGYYSSKYAKKYGIEVLEVQHHHAHILSVMAENCLYKPVIGVAFDGTGYGTDGAMWGGEFLVVSPEGFKRAGHLKYVPMLGGDSGVKEVFKTGYSYLYDSGLDIHIRDEKWPLMKAALANNINTVMSSSMGRLFDAVSFIAGIKSYSSFEGECAILLENCASDYMEAFSLTNAFYDYPMGKSVNGCMPYSYDIIEMDDKLVGDMKRCIEEIFADSLKGEDKRKIAWRFHLTVIDYILTMCTKLRELYNINDVALSGGVFQNSIVFEGAVNVLKHNGFNVFFNVKVPVNDGGISLGQVFAAMLEE
ncbi:MAG TPA: carbamoyltransferase HypF [Acetivibrio clariflavus]|nr:carbamoyltransferase HypF [Acetivibrio clariflavus]